ncbi:MAG: tRNA (adenosine(37)-N6)-threonylcarbamoyltransferase complex dimerization subunit type 1 TsaB [Gammaproteobacteria bacterium]
MNLLYLDTATPNLFLGIAKGKEDFIYQAQVGNQHAVLLLPALAELLRSADLNLKKDINAIFWANGPGSFTGLRIAGAMAQAFSWVAGQPIFGLSNLEVLAQYAYFNLEQLQKSEITVALDARKAEYYQAEYLLNKSSHTISQIGEVKLVSCSDLSSEALVFDQAVIGEDLVKAALFLARHYYSQWDPKTYNINQHLIPNYVRNSI